MLCFLTSCGTTGQTNDAAVKQPLTDRVQAAVVETQESVIGALPAEIAGFKSTEPVANREKKQRGAGFTRVYTAGDIVATVFVYNNQSFNVSEEPDAEMEVLMDKHLQEIMSYQDSGLYTNVDAGTKNLREFSWKAVKYQVLETEVTFSQRGENKKSLLVLGANKELMSYVRIRYTYPKEKQAEINKKHGVFTRTVMTALHNFAQAQKAPAGK